ncbi:iron-sulfur cluster biosynthesis family protein [Virgibacillus salarius]|uniref:iron-sulfur cluster biosynthesis family protein n=1 Tax=Virgibacillus salarius TaxID=447199 RepID=UPI001FE6D370|nr:iron-sulfur cluster biosynthesis family protein [Virgibacillus salarius]WBX79206.1 iron-sulfur cluster biosynthesis family protein [Virgibacillus salarius]
MKNNEIELNISKKAKDKLAELEKQHDPYLLFWYDIEGCGCGVNGIPTLRFTDQQKTNYQQIKNKDFTVYVENQQAIFFAKKMRLDYNKGMFRLSSPEGILNLFISPEDIIK